MISEQAARKIVFGLGAMLAGFVLVFLLILAWQWGLVPRRQAVEGTIKAPDGNLLRTRAYLPFGRVKHVVRQPHVPLNQPGRRTEVQLPSGRWVDCDGDDCFSAYEKTLK